MELQGLGYQQGGLKVNKYLYNGKEFNDHLGVNFYDFHARLFDPAIGRTFQIDPLQELYLSNSPYSWVANNPIRFVDPTGMKIEEGSQALWDAQKSNVIGERDRLIKKVDKISSRGQEKGWSADKISSKIGNKNERIESLENTVDTMNCLEGSAQVYSLSIAGEGELGGLTLNPETNVIDISFSGTANFVHEVAHGGQFEDGRIGFNSSSGLAMLNDVYDEVDAYRAQFAFSPSSVSGLPSSSRANSFSSINASWVQGIRFGGERIYLPGTDVNTGLSSIGINSNRGQLMKAFPHLSSSFIVLPRNYSPRNNQSNLHFKNNEPPL